MAKAVNPHPFMSPAWYIWTHEWARPGHCEFKRWLASHFVAAAGGTAMEIGCGSTGHYSHYFSGSPYIGVDADHDVIRYCEQYHPIRERQYWLWADIMDEDLPSADLVFSHAVIDHAPDIEAHLFQCIRYSRRWVYIMAYCGYLNDIAEHRQEQNKTDGYWYNRISVPALAHFLGLLDVTAFTCRRVDMARAPEEIQDELHIIIEK